MTTPITVAQAIASPGSGLYVTDTAANIANNLSNSSLVSRVNQFTINGNAAVTAVQAAALGAIGSQFSTGSYTLTLRDTVAQLIASGNAAGLTISGIVVAVQDTAAAVLAAASNSIIRNASSVALTANATLSLASLVTLEGLPHLSAVGLTFTLSDSAANLLLFTPGEAKSWLTIFQVGSNSSVSAGQAVTLGAMSHFGVAANVTLTITDTITHLAAQVSALYSVFILPGVAVTVADTLTDLLTQGTSFQWYLFPNVRATLSNSGSVTVSQAATLASLPHFSVTTGQTLIIADTVSQLATLGPSQIGIATAINLSGNDTATVAQLATLASFLNFLPVYSLTVDDTLAHLALLTVGETALTSAETIDDTVSNLLAAQTSALSGASAIVAELDGTTLTAAEATALARVAAHATLTLHANGIATTLTISDTSQNLSNASASITALETDGPVTVVTTTPVANRTILTAIAAQALVVGGTSPATETLAVADTGDALSAVASQIFGQGFEAITVTFGTFAGTMAELLDPTLHFATTSSAELNASAVANVAQAMELAALPTFTRAPSVTVTVLDSITAILAAASALPSDASSILANDAETVSAAGAAALATLVTLAGFSLNGNQLTLNDTAANLKTASVGAIALATTVNLTSDARISAATALQFVAMGIKFSPQGFFVTIADTAANLKVLATEGASQSVVNSWAGQAVLSADATIDVADATTISQFAGFNAGTHNLTISDSASNLLNASGSVLALAYAVQISQASTVTAANAATLEALHNFSAQGFLTIADTAVDLAATAASVATPASTVSLAVETVGNASGYAIDATQFAAMLALPNFSLAGFAGTVAVADTAASLAALAPSLANLSLSIQSHVTMTLSTAATVTVATAEALHALGDFSRGGYDLTISDTASNIATLDTGTAGLATSIVVTGGSSTLTAAAFLGLVSGPSFSSTPDSFIVSDSATALLTLVGNSNLAYVAATILNANATVLAADAERLSSLPGLRIGNYLTIADTAADLLNITGGGTTPDDWVIELQASSVVLTDDATIDTTQATLLTQLGSRFSAGAYTLTVRDTAANLVAHANAGGLALAGATTLSGTETALSAANATLLTSLTNFTKGAFQIIISDTAADLTYGGNAAGLALADHLQLSQPTSLTVGAAETLIGMQDFQVNSAAPITITGTLPHLLILRTAELPHNNGILAATPIALSQNAVATAAQIVALTTLPQYASFSRGGYTLTVDDSGENLAMLTPTSIAAASSVVLSGDALLTAAQADALAALSVGLGGYSLTVAGTVSVLLNGSNHTGLSIATSVVLSGSTMVDATDATSLFAIPFFSTGGHALTISDTASALLGLGEMPTVAATTLELSESGDVVTVGQLGQLAALGSKFSLNAQTLTVSGTLASLLMLERHETALVSSEIATDSGAVTLDAATATALANTHITLFNDPTIVVRDFAANLAFAGYAAGVALANIVQLSTPASLTASVAEALIGLANFQINDAAPITIDDTLRDLLGLSGASLTYNGNVLAVTPIGLSANAVATVAQMQALAELTQYDSFSLNGHTITVEDSGKHLASFVADTIAVPSAYVMTGDATLDAEQAAVLVTEHASLGDNSLTVADTPTVLLSLSDAVNALATGLSLSGASSATTGQATGLETLAAEHRFSTGGYALTVIGSAAELLSLSTPAQQLATTLALSETGDIVSVANLLQLAELGGRFSLNSNTLTVSDTAEHLAALNNLETALVSAAVLDLSDTVDAATATELAALPDFSLGTSVTLIVQDSYANLVALPGSITSIATLELTGSAPILNAAEAAVLAGLSNFIPSAGTVVQDSVANLDAVANAGWPAVAEGGYIVTDSVSDLLANAHTSLLSNANSVTLLGDAQVDAADFTTLAGMTNFSRGTAALTVADSPVAIANIATEIESKASSALVNAAAPVSAQQAEALAGLNGAHMLSFSGGISLAVQDSLGNLTLLANAGGLALASTVTGLRTGVELITATGHNWGTVQPYYELNANSDVGAQAATALQALGAHYLNGGFTLTVQDTAALVVSNETAIQALGIKAQVIDSVSDVAGEITQLGLLGGTLQSISLNDLSPVDAGTLAALVSLVAKLVGPAITVSDTAASVDANLAALVTLSAYISSVTVSDNAADVAMYASDLATLGTKLHVTLSDTAPITVAADIAAGLVPVDARLGGTTINVSDLAARVVTYVAALAELGSVLGTVTLSDGTAINAATAAALAQIDGHLGNAMFSVTDTVEAIDAAAAGLGTLITDDRISSITADGATVSDVLTYSATLANLGATATISDSAAHVSANLDALALLCGISGVVTQITLIDNGTPDIALSLGQITSDADVLGRISTGFDYAISDSSANIAHDLGSSSLILALGSAVHTITVNNSGTLTLSVGTLMTEGVDDSGTSALTKLTGGALVAVTGVTIGDFAEFTTLTVAPSNFAVADSGSNIGDDLERGSSNSVLLAHRASITGITPGGTITLDYATASTLHVNDGAGSIFSRMPGAMLDVTGVPATDIVAVLTTNVHAASITVTDSAGNIANNLETSSPTLVQYLSDITGITVSPPGAISLDAGYALASGVDDSASSVFGKMTGATLAVIGASVLQLSALLGLHLVPDTMTVSDSASSIEVDLVAGAGSAIESNIAVITGIAASGTIELDWAAASLVLPALGKLTSGTVAVSAVPVLDIGAIGGLGLFASMTVSDTATAIAVDLVLDGASQLAAYHGQITGTVTVSGGPVRLSDSQALAAAATALALLPAGSLAVSGVPVGDIAAVALIGTPLASMTVSDTASAIATDLRKGTASSDLEQHAGKIGSVTATGGPVALSDADAWAVVGALANFVADSLTLSGASLLHAATYATLTGLISMTVADSAADLYADLTGTTSLLETGAVAHTVTGIDVTGTAVQLSDSQAGQVLPALALLSGFGVTVSGVTVSDIGSIGGLGSALAGMTVSDTNTAIHDDLVKGLGSELYQYSSKIGLGGVTVSGGRVAILSTEVADVELAALALLPADTLVVTGVLVAGVAGLAGLTGLYQMTVGDSAAHVQSDIAFGGGHVLEAHYGKIGSITVTGGPVTLEDSDASVALHALALLAGLGTLVVDDVLVSDVTAIAGLSALSYMMVTDSAAAVQGDLELGGSLLQASALLIHGIGFAAGEGSAVTLSGIEAARVMDALAELPSGSLTVSDAAEAQVAALAGLTALHTMTVSDSASSIEVDLVAGAGSAIESNIAVITGIAASGTIELDWAAASLVLPALGKLTSGTVAVSAVPVLDIGAIGGLGLFASMTVSDTATAIAVDLILDGASQLAAYHGQITGTVTVSGGPVRLSDSQALAAAATALALLPAGSLAVSGVPVGDIAAVALIGTPLASMTVSDTASAITTDLRKGTASSDLEQHAGKIGSVTATGGPVALSDADAWAVVGALANLVAGSLTLSGASLLHAATYATLTGLISMTVADSAADLYADLTGTTSLLETGAVAHTVTGIDVTGTAVQLSDSQAGQVLPALALLTGFGVTVSGVTVSDIGSIGGLGSALAGMTVSDTNTAIHDDLVKGLGSELYQYSSKIGLGGVTVSGGRVAILSTEVADVELAALALLPADTLVVTGVLVAGVAGLAGLTGLYQMTVGDSAAHVQSDIAFGGGHVLEAHYGKIGSITVTGGPVTLEDSDASVALHALALLAGLGTLVVDDVLVSDVTAIAGLSALSYMTVTDSAAAVQGDLELSGSLLQASALLIHGIGFAAGEGSAVTLSGIEAARVMDALAELPSGSLTVSDAAEAQVAALAGLTALHTMTVSDSASSIEVDLVAGAGSAIESNIAVITGIAASGTIELDWAAASLVLPALGKLTSGTVAVSAVPVLDIGAIGGLGLFASMTVSDTATAIAVDLVLDGASQLAAYHGQITGTVTVSGGPVRLSDSQALAAAATALALLPAGSLAVSGVPVGDIAAVALIGTPLASMTVSDTASAIATDLRKGTASSDLEQHAGKIGSVTATGGPVALSDADAWAVVGALANFVADSLTLSGASLLHAATYATLTGLISMTVADSAADLYADLTGTTSLLETGAVAHTVTGIDVTGTAVQLSDSQAGQVLPALALLTGFGVTVSRVTVSDIGSIGGLGSALAGMTVSDTNTAIHDDLVKGLGSELYQYSSKIGLGGVTVSGGRVAILSTEVADVELAALALLPADTLVVTGVLVAGVAGLAGLTGLYQMTVGDSAAHVQSDIAFGGGHVLEAHYGKIGSITVTGGPVTLEDSDASVALHALALLAGLGTLVVDDVLVSDVTAIAGLSALSYMTVTDSAAAVQGDLELGGSLLQASALLIHGIGFAAGEGSAVTLSGIEAARVMDALAELPSGSLTVSDAAEAQVAALAGLTALHTMTVNDSASSIEVDLVAGAGSAIESNIAVITGIAASGTIELDWAAASLVLPALGKLTSGTVAVSAVPVLDIGAIGGLGLFASMTVSDTATAIAVDLILDGASQLAAYHGQITGTVTVSGGPVRLSDSQALAAAATALALLPAGSLAVSGVPVGDIAAVALIGTPLASMTVSDTASAIATDLRKGTASSDLEQHAGKIGSVTATGGPVALSDADAWAVVGALANFVADSLTLSGASLLHAATYATLTGLISMTVADSAADLYADLTGTTSLLETGAVAHTVTGIDVTGTAVQLSDSQAGQVLPALALLTGFGVTVSGVTVSDIGSIGGLGSALAGMTVSDTNTAIHDDLVKGLGSELYQYSSKIGLGGVTVSGGRVAILSTEVADVELAALALLPADTLVVTGVLVAGVAGLAGLTGLYQMTVGDSAAHVQSDIAFGGGHVLEAHYGKIGSITVTGGPVTLEDSDASVALHALALLAGLGTLVVDDVLVSDVTAIAGLSALSYMTVTDSAAAVQGDLELSGSLLQANALLIHGIGFAAGEGSAVTLSGIEAARVMDALAELPSGSLTVSDAAEAQVAALAGLTALHTMTVSDSASSIEVDLVAGAGSAIESNIAVITGIAASGTIELDWAAASLVLPALGKLTSGTVAVSAVPVLDIGAIGGLGLFASMTVSDTATAIAVDLVLDGASQLAAYHGQITGTVTVSGGPVRLSDSQALAAAATALALLPAGSLAVSGVPVGDIAAVALIGTPLASMTVSDTASAIATDLRKGTASSDLEQHAGKIGSVTATGGPVALSDADAWAVVGALANFVADSLTLSGASLLHAATYATLTGLISMTVADSAADLYADLTGTTSLLETGAVAHTVTGIDVTGTAVQLSDSQAGQVLPALALLTGFGVTVSRVTVSDIGSIGGLGSALAGMTVSDTNTAIHDDLVKGLGSELYQYSSKIGLGGVTVSGGKIALNDAQADSVLSALGNLPSGSLVVTGVPVSDILTIAAVSSLDHMTVVDSASNIVADVNGTGKIASKLGSISSVAVSDGSIDATDAIAIYGAFISKFDESALTINDTASALVTAQQNAPGALSAANQVTLSVNASGVSAMDATTLVTVLRDTLGSKTLGVADTASNLLTSAYVAGIDFATTVQLSTTQTIAAAAATQLAGLHGFTSGPAITIQDSPTNLLDPENATGLGIATTVEPDGPYAVVATTLAALALIHGFRADGQAITVTGNVSAITGLSTAALGFTALVHVTDSSVTVAAGLDALQSAVSAHGDAMTITLTDGTPSTPTIFINATTYAADRGAIDSIATTGAVNVTDGASALAAVASELAGDTVVAEVEASDSAVNILANLTALESIGTKLGNVTITDSSLNASEVSALLTIPNLQTGALTISDTGSQIAAAIQANGPPGVTFLKEQTVTLSSNSVIAASDAVLLEEVTNLNKNGKALVVWDTASHLTDSADGYLAAEKNSLITAVYLKTTNGTATITAATAATLLSIPTFSKDNPPALLGGTGTSNTLTLSDTAAHIDAQYSTLHGHASSLSSIVVSGSASVTESVYADLLALGAVMANGQSLTVRDTAAIILANAPTQLGGSHSISPAAWQISGSAPVSESDAAYLAGLTGFSAGAYTLTLSGSDATTTQADANAIGTLGGSFHLGGYQLTVSGTVSYVSGLSPNARLIVTSNITDSFAQIATLTLGDGLLNGSIVVNDSETPTTTQANAFLALLGGSGIPVAKVHFGGNVETITDTLTNIQGLTSSGAWTANTSVHSDFSLVVADTVLTLIDSANTTALEAMHATTLKNDQTVRAADAESLFAVATAINFTLGNYAITIQDSAAALLNPSNSDGEAIAAVLELAGADSVNAAGAETLLPNADFHLNYLLTVNDTSDNLLDGVLSGVITAADAHAIAGGYGGSVQVTLSDAETLDANTAEALVSLPGFDNTGQLSIADGSTYLLNPNNITAETDATSVTLAGNETVSAATAAKLAALPNFALDGNTLSLASNDYANAATLKAIADFGTGFSVGSATLTMTQDNVSLTPTEYTALQSDNIVLNGHALSAIPTVASVSSSSGDVFLTASGISGATLNVYAASGGTALSSSTLGSSSISVTQSDAFGTVGGAVVVTETMPGHSAATGESAPLIVIDQTIITNDAGLASFAGVGGAGTVQVGTNEYMHLYTAGLQPASPANPVLVYDPTAHTLSFDVASTSVVLVTLGAQTHPASLSPAEIFVTHFA